MRSELKKKTEALVAAIKTKDEWRQVWHVMSAAQRSASRADALEARKQFRVGDRVSFHSSKYGTLKMGTVEAILEKNIKVNTDDRQKWRVDPRVLKKTDTERKCEVCKRQDCICPPIIYYYGGRSWPNKRE